MAALRFRSSCSACETPDLRVDQERWLEVASAALGAGIVAVAGIEQAKGVLAAHHGTTVTQAFERLRSHARSHNATIRSVTEAHRQPRPAPVAADRL